MKYLSKILIVLAICCLVVFGVYRMTVSNVTAVDSDLTTVSKIAATEKSAGTTLIASLDDKEIYLYKTGSGAKVVFNDTEFEYDDWSTDIDKGTPELYYIDMDGDDTKEVVAKVVEYTDDNGDYIYEMYVLKPSVTTDEETGEEVTTMTVSEASRNTWATILENKIYEQVSQLTNCTKIIQFAMATSSDEIKYDTSTGIATAGYVGWATALKDENYNYYTINGWNKGTGTYYINDNNKIAVSIEIYVTYDDEDGTSQYIGDVVFALAFNSSGSFTVANKSMVFTATDKYKVSDPTVTSDVNWSMTINNSTTYYNTATDDDEEDDTKIDWIKFTHVLDTEINTTTESFGAEQTDIKKVKNVEITNKYVKLTAQDGYTFDADEVSKGGFSVVINEGTEDEYEISYTITVADNLLTIYFDKSYPADEIQTFQINFGTT